MELKRLDRILKERGLSPETLAKLSNGDFSNMTVRRAINGNSIDRLKAKAIARVLRVGIKEIE